MTVLLNNHNMIPKFCHTRHWKNSLSVHRDDHYHVDPSFFIGKHVTVTEKLDGGNTGIGEQKAYARSTGQAAVQSWFDYVKTNTIPKLYGLDSNLILYGEDLYATHSIIYSEIPDSYFLFHVLDRDTMMFQSWADVKMIAEMYDLLVVPTVFEGVFDSVDAITDFYNEEIKKPSAYGPTREGFVMRISDAFHYDDFELKVNKFVRRGHVQTSDKHWIKTWKPANIRKG